MIELPEAITLAKQLNDTVKGKTIKSAKAGASHHGFAFYTGDPAQYDFLLREKKIGETRGFGGIVEMDAGDLRILINDGVTPRYYENTDNIPKKHQLLIEFDDNTAIVCTVQMYGGMLITKNGAHDDFYYAAAKQKPSPLSDNFSEDYFYSLLSCTKKTLSVKALLATEQRIPGLGNGALQDILFNAGINPKTKALSLPDNKLSELFSSVKQTLEQMTHNGGRDTEKDLYGAEGGYNTILSYKTYKFPCQICGEQIVKKAYLGGSVYFCPKCQPES